MVAEEKSGTTPFSIPVKMHGTRFRSISHHISRSKFLEVPHPDLNQSDESVRDVAMELSTMPIPEQNLLEPDGARPRKGGPMRSESGVLGFPPTEMEVPQQLDGLQLKTTLKWMIWGYSSCRKPPNGWFIMKHPIQVDDLVPLWIGHLQLER